MIAGLNVPEDVSIIGFDDIYEAKFNNPSLTTIRQPLKKWAVWELSIFLKKFMTIWMKAFLKT